MFEVRANLWAILIYTAIVGVAAFVAGWLVTRPDKAPVMAVDRPPPVQPTFEGPATDQPPQGIAKSPIQPTVQEKQEISLNLHIPPVTVAPKLDSPAKTSPCPPFSLHLVSSDSVPKKFGLDSVSVFYSYPSGDHPFSYWGKAKNQTHKQSGRRSQFSTLSIETQSDYQTYLSRLSVGASLCLSTSRFDILGGYRVIGNSHPSWFVGVRKEWRVF